MPGRACSLGTFLFLFLAIALAGCRNTCFVFTSNPGAVVEVKTGNPPPACRLSKANAAVGVSMHAAASCEACSPSGRIEHIFVSLRGIELHRSAIADDASAEWQELAPQLAQRPLQVDLMKGTEDASAAPRLGERALIPAGEYRQVRLRFVANQPAADEPIPQRNACGGVGFNCVATADGRIRTLIIAGAASQTRITSDTISGGFLFVPPESNAEVAIELGTFWTLANSGSKLELLPALGVKRASLH